jgi:hypothetical protein
MIKFPTNFFAQKYCPNFSTSIFLRARASRSRPRNSSPEKLLAQFPRAPTPPPCEEKLLAPHPLSNTPEGFLARATPEEIPRAHPQGAKNKDFKISEKNWAATRDLNFWAELKDWHGFEPNYADNCFCSLNQGMRVSKKSPWYLEAGMKQIRDRPEHIIQKKSLV